MATKLGLSPLLTGEAPRAPAWFERAIADEPERGSMKVAGADIELLTWGKVGDPGLLFLHGKGAHADWWSFIAPFFSDRFRVAAISWSGMGRSDWRDSYSEAVLTEEALAALEAGKLCMGSERPILVAHSFGGMIASRLCELIPERFRAVVLVDPPIFSKDVLASRRSRWSQNSPGNRRVYSSLEAALRRFRFAPEQACDNGFIADFIARRSLTMIETDEGPGWRWCFDPGHWAPHRQNAIVDLPRRSEVSYAVIIGEQSALYALQDLAYIRAACQDIPLISIPEAAHHVMVDQPLALVSALRSVFAGLKDA